MFVAAERTLELPCRTVQARLAGLIRVDGLRQACCAAYAQGLSTLAPAGPGTGGAGPARLAEVRLLDPIDRAGVVTFGLRWETASPASGLFPVLDANLTLAPHGDHRTRLALTGSYRPPLGGGGEVPDQTAVQRAASATAGALLACLTAAAAGDGPDAGGPGSRTGP